MLTATQNNRPLNTAASLEPFDPLHTHLDELLRLVAKQNYRFISVTPATHERYLARGITEGTTLQDIFGWNLSFKMDVLPPPLRRLMTEAKLTAPCGKYVRSIVRISSIANDVFLHSAFPTTAADDVFLGPDTYRFARFIRQGIKDLDATFDVTHSDKPMRILDIGCGSGAGGVAAVRALKKGQAYDLTMNDINPAALDYTLINTRAADVSVNILPGDIFTNLEGKFDLILSNPPYMSDTSGRTYRDGGARLGRDLSVRIAQRAIEHLAPGGRLILYTGVAMTDQSDPFLSELLQILTEMNCHWSYEEIDPDIFGEELTQPVYENAYRIAAVGLTVDQKN